MEQETLEQARQDRYNVNTSVVLHGVICPEAHKNGSKKKKTWSRKPAAVNCRM